MSTHRFSQVDVFTGTPLLGNPVAVVHDADGLGDSRMAALARWTNLSETTFLLPPTDPAADYRVRIFTVWRELPFAGHPTLGSCHAWLAAGGVPHRVDEIVQQCPAGLIQIRRQAGGRLAFAAPPCLRSGPLDDALLVRIVGGLGLSRDEVLDHQWVDNGPGWCAIRLGSAARVLALEPDWSRLGDLQLGVVAPQEAAHAADFEVRALVGLGSGSGFEDPVTGSLQASLAQWLISSGAAPPSYVAAQGARLGRSGRVFIDEVDGQVWVGGQSIGCIQGELTL